MFRKQFQCDFLGVFFLYSSVACCDIAKQVVCCFSFSLSVFSLICIFVNIHTDFTNLNPQCIFLRVGVLCSYRCVCAAAWFSAPDRPLQAGGSRQPTDCGRGVRHKRRTAPMFIGCSRALPISLSLRETDTRGATPASSVLRAFLLSLYPCFIVSLVGRPCGE